MGVALLGGLLLEGGVLTSGTHGLLRLGSWLR